MSDIPAVSISQYCDIRSSKRVFARDYCDSGVPFYRGKEIIEKYNGALSVSTELFISEEKFAELCAKLGAPQPGDLLLTSVGTLGVPYVVSPGERFYFKDGNLTWFYNFDGLDSTYLYYWLVSPTGKAELAKATIGSSQSAFTIVLLKDMQIACPPLPTQRKIASILSAYDDLIENNTRRIAILEEMAQAIYREWFVNFRFPGHENVTLVDSPLGQIPEGWAATKLKDITTKIGSGATPRGGKSAYQESGITLIRSLNVYDYNFQDKGLAFIDETQAEQLDNVIVEKHDILLNITGASVARCCMPRSDLLPARVNQHVAIIRTDKEAADPLYVLSAINSDRHKKHLLALAQGGATREALTKTTIQNFEILLPDPTTLRTFAEIAEGLFEQRELLQRKNENLRSTRDLLLPKLISGKLDVEDLDIDVGMTTKALEEAIA
ncbi:MAG: restriction endonuclease subunit S [Candidatus Paceibacterota bacterium]